MKKIIQIILVICFFLRPMAYSCAGYSNDKLAAKNVFTNGEGRDYLIKMLSQQTADYKQGKTSIDNITSTVDYMAQLIEEKMELDKNIKVSEFLSQYSDDKKRVLYKNSNKISRWDFEDNIQNSEITNKTDKIINNLYMPEQLLLLYKDKGILDNILTKYLPTLIKLYGEEFLQKHYSKILALFMLYNRNSKRCFDQKRIDKLRQTLDLKYDPTSFNISSTPLPYLALSIYLKFLAAGKDGIIPTSDLKTVMDIVVSKIPSLDWQYIKDLKEIISKENYKEIFNDTQEQEGKDLFIDEVVNYLRILKKYFDNKAISSNYKLVIETHPILKNASNNIFETLSSLLASKDKKNLKDILNGLKLLYSEAKDKSDDESDIKKILDLFLGKEDSRSIKNHITKENSVAIKTFLLSVSKGDITLNSKKKLVDDLELICIFINIVGEKSYKIKEWHIVLNSFQGIISEQNRETIFANIKKLESSDIVTFATSINLLKEHFTNKTKTTIESNFESFKIIEPNFESFINTVNIIGKDYPKVLERVLPIIAYHQGDGTKHLTAILTGLRLLNNKNINNSSQNYVIPHILSYFFGEEDSQIIKHRLKQNSNYKECTDFLLDIYKGNISLDSREAALQKMESMCRDKNNVIKELNGIVSDLIKSLKGHEDFNSKTKIKWDENSSSVELDGSKNSELAKALTRLCKEFPLWKKCVKNNITTRGASHKLSLPIHQLQVLHRIVNNNDSVNSNDSERIVNSKLFDDFSEEDQAVMVIASIFHDISKMKNNTPIHPFESADLVKKMLIPYQLKGAITPKFLRRVTLHIFLHHWSQYMVNMTESINNELFKRLNRCEYAVNIIGKGLEISDIISRLLICESEIAIRLAEADLYSVDLGGKFYRDNKDNLKNNKNTLIEKTSKLEASVSCLKLTDFSKFPKTEIIEGIKVIDAREEKVDCLAHVLLNFEQNLKNFLDDALAINPFATVSASYFTQGNHKTYKSYTLGLLISIDDITSIIFSANSNVVSLSLLDLLRVVINKTYKEEWRNTFPDKIKEVFKITDHETYIAFIRELFDTNYFENEPNNYESKTIKEKAYEIKKKMAKIHREVLLNEKASESDYISWLKNIGPQETLVRPKADHVFCKAKQGIPLAQIFKAIPKVALNFCKNQKCGLVILSPSDIQFRIQQLISESLNTYDPDIYKPLSKAA